MSSTTPTKSSKGDGGTSSSKAASSSSGGVALPPFPVGTTGKRELRRALLRARDPKSTIRNFQQAHSLHSMCARAFGTSTRYEVEASIEATKNKKSKKKKDKDKETNTNNEEDDNNKDNDKVVVESLDTDSALMFLSKLGVSQYEVHKRISDTLRKQLLGEIRKSSPAGSALEEKGLLNLLSSCWAYATAIPELRPVLWAVLKQLGERTPRLVLTALAERDNKRKNTNGTKKMKHEEIFRQLPPLLERLVWEAEWDEKIPPEVEIEPAFFYQQIQSTLVYETVVPLIKQYCTNPLLVEAANKPFVATFAERKVLTNQRRALKLAGGIAGPGAPTGTAAAPHPPSLSNVIKGTVAGVSIGVGSVATASGGLGATSIGGGAAGNTHSHTSGEAVAQLREKLRSSEGSGVVPGASAATYRPKLLYATLSILMSMHASENHNIMGCANHLHCTLVADLLLSVSTGLPKAYEQLSRLARILDDSVKEGILTDKNIIRIQSCLRLIFQPPQQETVNDSSTKTGDGSDSKNDKNKDDVKNKATALSKTASKSAASPSKKKITEKSIVNTAAFKRKLNQIITASIDAMKDADPQKLFLNPVTDEIAPGYSQIITKPMCIVTMEDKVRSNQYTTIKEFEDDVKLMYKNCVEYNKGTAGQWFRGEANRQKKVFMDEVMSQAKKLYQQELNRKMNPPPLPTQAGKDDKSKTKQEGEDEKQVADSASRKRKQPGADLIGKPKIGIGIGVGALAQANNAKEAALFDSVTPLPPMVVNSKKIKKNNEAVAAKNEEDKDETKKKTPSQQQEHYIPSIPALATMLIADPFVVRLLLDRLLRSIRKDITGSGIGIPVGHTIVPSLLQILYIAQWSKYVCFIRGNKYMIPDIGINRPSNVDDPLSAMPYDTLRRYLPLLSRLLLEAELDKRVVKGGDLHDASQSFGGVTTTGAGNADENNKKDNVVRPKPPLSKKSWSSSSRRSKAKKGEDVDVAATKTATTNSTITEEEQQQIIIALVEGALVHTCRPGNSLESSLSVTFPKFATVLQHLSTTISSTSNATSSASGLSSAALLWDNHGFFICLIQSILKHKSKLNHTARDSIVSTWLQWLRQLQQQQEQYESDDDGNDDDDLEGDKKKKKKKNQDKTKKKKTKIVVKGSMTSACHECFIFLLNEWATLGNLLLPRDKLIQFSIDAVEASNSSEIADKRHFVVLWKQVEADEENEEKQQNKEIIDNKKDDDDDANEKEGGGDQEEEKDSSNNKKGTTVDSSSSSMTVIHPFLPIKKQYERMLLSLPENHRQQWKEKVGLIAVEEETANHDDDDHSNYDNENTNDNIGMDTDNEDNGNDNDNDSSMVEEMEVDHQEVADPEEAEEEIDNDEDVEDNNNEEEDDEEDHDE